MPHVDRNAPQVTVSASCGNCIHWVEPGDRDARPGECSRDWTLQERHYDACDSWEPKAAKANCGSCLHWRRGEFRNEADQRVGTCQRDGSLSSELMRCDEWEPRA